MANFIHDRQHLKAGDIVIVTCSHRCNVMLLDDYNFRSYRARGRFSYHGGHYTHFPARITAPQTGDWNIVLDLGGGTANIRYSFNFIKAA
jgi:hypothetical protein